MFSHSWTTFQAPLMSSWGHFGACWNGHGSKNATNQAIWQLQYISFKSTIVGILWLWQAQSRLIVEAPWYFRGCPKKQDKTTPYFGSTFNHEPTVTKFTPFPLPKSHPWEPHDIPWPMAHHGWINLSLSHVRTMSRDITAGYVWKALHLGLPGEIL